MAQRFILLEGRAGGDLVLEGRFQCLTRHEIKKAFCYACVH